MRLISEPWEDSDQWDLIEAEEDAEAQRSDLEMCDLLRRTGMGHIGCKHLDYREGHYPQCEIITMPDGRKYWQRNNLPYPEAPRNVQFCGNGRGRINKIHDCIDPGFMHCFEPQEPCEICHGSGGGNNDPCSKCGGKGYLE